MKLLHIDSSILGDNSMTRRLTAEIVGHLAFADPSLSVVYRDLVADSLPHFTAGHLPGADGDDQADAKPLNRPEPGAQALDEFLASDIIVIGAPMYNFTISSQLKAWVDRILVAGKTFRYTEAGPVGLAGAKRVILALARGGFYGADTPMASFEHAEQYLRSVFSFIGIGNPEIIEANGIALGIDARSDAARHASDAIRRLTVTGR